MWGPTTAFDGKCAAYIISIPGPRVGADSNQCCGSCNIQISIHGPRVGADGKLLDSAVDIKISIHGPRVGADQSSQFTSSGFLYFNPRPPCGGRRIPFLAWNLSSNISIHGPRVGADLLF